MTTLEFLKTIHAFTTFPQEWVSIKFVEKFDAEVQLKALHWGYVQHRVSDEDGPQYFLTNVGYTAMKNDELMLSMDC